MYASVSVEEEHLRPGRCEEGVYRAYRLADRNYWCPVLGCMGTSTRPWNMRRHFAYRHPWDLVEVPEEGLLPQCKECSMPTSDYAFQIGHLQSATYIGVGEQRRQHQRSAGAVVAQVREFRIYGDVLKWVEAFKDLGRWLSQDDTNARALRAQLNKARRCWARVGRVLRSENASPRICGKFYNAVVQAVLLYGSETWTVSPALLARLEGFHIRSCYRMASEHRPQKEPGGRWVYPASEDVVKACGL